MAEANSRPVSPGGTAVPNDMTGTNRLNRTGCNYACEQLLRQAQPPLQRCFARSVPRQFRITGIWTVVTHLRQEASSRAHRLNRSHLTARFALFPISTMIGDVRLKFLQSIHVIVESDLGGCIVDEMNVHLAAGLQCLDPGASQAE